MKAKTIRRILALVLTIAMVLTFVPAAFASSFPDVPDNAWYAEAVDYCFDKNLMQGTGNGFAPNGKVTREMAVQTLYAMAGAPASEYEAIFSDVAAGKWYTPAIMWGAKFNIVAGDGKGHFNVGVAVTREQVAMFFYNYANFIGLKEDYAPLNDFPDEAKVSSWATTAVQWAVAMGVLSGKAIDGKNYLKPQDPLTRAELASILYRFYSKYVDGKIEVCNHEETEIRNAKPATCTEPGYTGDEYCVNPDCNNPLVKKGEVIPALGHDFVDGFCSRCGEPDPDCGRTFTLSDELPAGTQVIIYSPGHGMVVTNETDNDWYLVPEARTPDGDAFIEEDFGDFDNFVWTVVDNGDGTVSFINGDNAIAAWLSGTYIELTNKADYEGADTKWIVTFIDGLAYIQSSSLSNSYGPAYIECFYNANKDKTNISGYTSSNPSSKSNDFGFQIYVSGTGCAHVWDNGTVVAPTCTEDGYTLFTCTKCDATKKDNIVPALGHNYVDGECTVCGDKQKSFVLSDTIADGMQVVIYNPGHGMAIKNETDNNWYLVPEIITPEDDVISNPDDSLVWTVVDNGDGTYSFVNGDNAIAAWLSGTYIELTNDANYDGADIKWTVTFTDGLAYIGSSSLSNSYGPAYIECYYNANKDKTNISGYTSSDPAAKSNDFGFQFYVSGDVCDHDWVAGTPVAPTCTEDGYTPYTCSKCGASKKEVIPAAGHDFGDDNTCDVCGYVKPEGGKYALTDSIKDGDEVIIYNPGHGMAISNENDNNWYLVPVAVTPVDDVIETEDTGIVWTVVDNGDGTFSFTNGDNAIVAWLSVQGDKSYIELTNDANYDGADGKWIVTFAGGLAYIQSSTLSNSYGPAYIECFYNANKDKTNISGYTSSDPAAKSNDFGFRFYVSGDVCDHDWVAGTPVAPTCTEDGYTPYTCSKCNAVKTGDVVPATGHDFGDDNTCDVCGYEKPELGDSVAIFYPTDNKVMTTESYFYNNKKYELAAADATLTDGIISTDAENVALFSPVVDGEYTTFVTEDGKYLSADGTNVELVDVETDNTKFVVEEADGGVFLRCATAQYSGKPQYIEFYSNYFTVYSFNESNKGIYTFVLAPVAARCDHEWEETENVAAKCTEAGYITYTCSLCGKTKTEEGAAATGHVDANSDQICDACGKSLATGSYSVADSIAVGDKIVLVAHVSDAYYAMSNDSATIKNALAGVAVTIDGKKVVVSDETVVWEVCAGSAAGSITLKSNDGKYISWATSTTLTLGAAGTDLTATCGEGTSTLLFTGTLDASNVRGLFARDNDGVQFRAYVTKNVGTSGYCDGVTIYKLD